MARPMQDAIGIKDDTPAGLAVTAEGTLLSLNPQAENLFGYTSAERVGHGLHTLLFDLPRIEAARPPAVGAAQLQGLVFGRHRDGRLSPLYCDSRPSGSGVMIDLQPAAGIVGNSPELSPDYNPVTHEQLLTVLNRLLQSTSSDVPPGQLLNHALDRFLALPELAGGQAAIYFLDTHGKQNIPTRQRFPDCLPRDRRQTTQIAACLRALSGAAKKSALVSPAGAGRLSLGVPILKDAQPLGIFTMSVSGTSRWLESGALWMIAETLATLILRIQTETQNQHLLEENRRLSQRLIGILEEERRKIARELHDDVGQSLTAIKTDAALILNHSQSLAAPITQSARAIATTADHLYAVTHNLLRQLRPGALDDLGLEAALRSHVNDWCARRPGTACEFRIHGDLNNLGENINIALFRVIQEALNNVIRHAAATRVDIVLQRNPATDGAQQVCLLVSDNGRGVDPESIAAKQRHGLVGIRERIEALRGKLTLVSYPNLGFSLLACVPVDPGHEDV